MAQMPHLNTIKSLGHLIIDAQVMQFPVAKSLLPLGPAPPRLWFAPVRDVLDTSSIPRRSSGWLASGTWPLLFPPNIDVKGWLIERECCTRSDRALVIRGIWVSESEELDSSAAA